MPLGRPYRAGRQRVLHSLQGQAYCEGKLTVVDSKEDLQAWWRFWRRAG